VTFVDEQILKELLIIKKKSKDGLLHPEAIVAYAMNEDTALHTRFEWDDGKAAQEYRIWQARQLIRIVVRVVPHTNIETAVFVSLKKDRYGDTHGGFRTVVEVLSDEDLRKELLQDALEAFNYWKEQYYLVQELIPIFEAAEDVKKKFRFFDRRKKKLKKK
jgi:hypothetical protein